MLGFLGLILLGFVVTSAVIHERRMCKIYPSRKKWLLFGIACLPLIPYAVYFQHM